MPIQTPASILIVEWHPIISADVRSALARGDEFDVVGQALSSLEATRLARAEPPALVLCETTLPEPGAIELARFFRMRLPRTVVAFVTRAASESELFEATRVGVAAYLRAHADERTFLATLRRALAGEFPIDEEVVRYPSVASRILAQFRASGSEQMRANALGEGAPSEEGAGALAPLYIPLSSREIEILDLVARGNSNKLIARRLGISDQTVKNHVSAILRKLEVNDRTEAVVYAIRNGWIRVDTPARA